MMLLKKFDAATKGRRSSPDYNAIIAVTDELNRNPDSLHCHSLADAIEANLKSRDPSMIWTSLLVLDTAMKNCGSKFHAAVHTKPMMHEIKKMIKKWWGRKSGFGSSNPIGGLAAQMLQLWYMSFSASRYPYFSAAYQRLLDKGIRFPPPTEGNVDGISPDPVTSKPKKTPTKSSHSQGDKTHIPTNVSSTLSAAGESLVLLFSITEDPNAPVPQDLLDPIVQALQGHSEKIVELINANMENEDAVRRLLEVNDQIDTALKRVNKHHNIVDAESDSDSTDPTTPPTKSKSASASNISVADSSSKKHGKSSSSKSTPNKTNGSSGETKKHSRKTKGQQQQQSQGTDLIDFLGLGPNKPVSSPEMTSPSSSFATGTATASSSASEFDAFDFGSSSSAFSPTANGWATFGQPFAAPYATQSQNMFTTPAQGSLGSPTPNGFGTPSSVFSSPSSSAASLPYPNTFSASSPSLIHTMPASPSSGHAFNPFGSPSDSVIRTQAPPSQTSLGSPFAFTATSPPATAASSANAGRLANTFGKYWMQDSVSPSAAQTTDPFASSRPSGGPVSAMDIFAPVAPSTAWAGELSRSPSQLGRDHPTHLHAAPAVTTAPVSQSASTNPFL